MPSSRFIVREKVVKAAVLVAPKQFELRDVPDPECGESA